MKRALRLVAIVALVSTVPCTPALAKDKIVTYAAKEGMDVPAAGPDESVIVFLRASKLGGAIAATVYERSDDGSLKFITAVYPDTYTVHNAAPGKHVFAVVSEAADFIEVDAAPEKIYPIMVTPRMGAWKARFSLQSGCPGSEFWAKMKAWLDESFRVTPNDAAPSWFAENRASVMKKVDDYWLKWIDKPDRPLVKADDGVTAF